MDEFYLNDVKLGGFSIPVSNEMLMDAGLMPDTRPAVVVPRRTRIRLAVAEWWHYHRPRLHFGPCDHSDCW